MRYAIRSFAAIAALLAAACAHPPPDLDPVATVQNQTGRTISEIRFASCEEAPQVWEPIDSSTIDFHYGTTIRFDLPAPCVNLKAYYANGEVAGTQSGIQKRFPFHWVLR